MVLKKRTRHLLQYVIKWRQHSNINFDLIYPKKTGAEIILLPLLPKDKINLFDFLLNFKALYKPPFPETHNLASGEIIILAKVSAMVLSIYHVYE